MSVACGWLALQLWCARIGIVRAAAVLLCMAAAVVSSLWLPHLRSDAAAIHNALGLAQHQLLLPVTSHESASESGPDHLAELYDALGDKRHAEQQLKTLFDLAQKNALRLSTADYKTPADKNSRLQIRQITLPVKATYPAIRQFAEQVLLAIPFASLDELHFKRDAIGSPLLDARLRFSLYLLESPAMADDPKSSLKTMQKNSPAPMREQDQ